MAPRPAGPLGPEFKLRSDSTPDYNRRTHDEKNNYLPGQLVQEPQPPLLRYPILMSHSDFSEAFDMRHNPMSLRYAFKRFREANSEWPIKFRSKAEHEATYQVTSFYGIFSRLPQDIKTIVISHLDSRSIRSLLRSPAPAMWSTWHPRIKTFGLRTLQAVAQVQIDIRDIVWTRPRHLFKEVVKLQYPLEGQALDSFSFQIDTDSVFDKPSDDDSDDASTMTNKYECADPSSPPLLALLDTLWQIQITACLATRAIQVTFPRLAQTMLLQRALTYMLFWAPAPGTRLHSSPTPPHPEVMPTHDRKKHLQVNWTYFGNLPWSAKFEISNFFDNLEAEFLDIFPFPYPTLCSSRACGFHDAARAPGTAVRCPHCNRGWRCWWRAPRWLGEELEALGITRMLARQYTVWQIMTLIYRINNPQLENACPPALDRYVKFFADMMGHQFGWHDHLNHSDIKIIQHGPGAEIAIRLASWKLLLVLDGRRGDGLVQLRVLPQFQERRFREHAWVMEQAMNLPQGQHVNVKEWDTDLKKRGGILMEVDRCAYWDMLISNSATAVEAHECLRWMFEEEG